LPSHIVSATDGAKAIERELRSLAQLEAHELRHAIDAG
jgi:hypothetical protein